LDGLHESIREGTRLLVSKLRHNELGVSVRSGSAHLGPGGNRCNKVDQSPDNFIGEKSAMILPLISIRACEIRDKERDIHNYVSVEKAAG
jgi:hypothetical protein